MDFDRVKGVFFRYYSSVLKGPHQLTDIFYWPFIDILLWGLAAVWIQEQNQVGHLSLVLMTALIFWQVCLRGSIDIAFCLLQEFWSRNLLNLFSTPLKLSEWISGVLVFCLCKLMVSFLFASAVIYFLYGLNVFGLGSYILLAICPLFLFGLSLGFFTSGLIMNWGRQVEVLAWSFGFIFAPFSAVFYPVSVLPFWAQKISWMLPTTYIFEGMRQILKGEQLPQHYFLFSSFLTFIYLFLSFLFFYRMFEKSREKGLNRLI